MYVIKRGGQRQVFDLAKIEKALEKAFKSVNGEQFTHVPQILLKEVKNNLGVIKECHVEDIQDIVEKALMKWGFYGVAKAYILYREQHNQIRIFTDKKKQFIENYKKASTTADATIDDNANVSNHNIAVLNAELHKEDTQQLNFRAWRDKIQELYPDFDYKQFDADINTILHPHDSSSQYGMPYCVAVTMYPYYVNGIKNIGGLSGAPKHLSSFCTMFTNMMFDISSQFKGACLYKNQELLINRRYVKIKDFVNSFSLDKSFVSDGTTWEYADVDGFMVNEDGKEVSVRKVYRRPYSDKIYVISSSKGLQCEVSKDHKFKVLRKGITMELPAKDLHLYDTVFIENNMSDLVDFSSKEYKRNFVLGMLLGDGCLTKENAVILATNYNQEYDIETFNDYSEEVFGYKLHKNKGHRCWNSQKCSKEYKDAIMYYLTGVTTFDKNIKPCYLETLDECCGFLDGIMSTDGADRKSFGLSLVNKSLIESCILALQRLNVHYTYSETPAHDNKAKLYNLSFACCASCYIPNFMKRIKPKKRGFSYRLSGYAKKWTNGSLEQIQCTKTYKGTLNKYHTDVITALDTLDNDDTYVYEIETETHWYNCGGFITHNCAVPGFFLGMDYFCRKRWGDDYYLRKDKCVASEECLEKQTIEEEIDQWFQTICYTLMQPSAARSMQAVFWNVSIFDKAFYDTMYSDFYFPDGTRPNWNSFNYLQKHFMTWLNKERLTCMLTFPVVSVALIYKDGDFADKEMYDFVCQEYSKGDSFFTYISDSADSLSSCCRLSSKIDKPQFNFTNGQIGESTGSKNVITLDLNRIVQDWVHTTHTYSSEEPVNPRDGLDQYLIAVLDRVYKYQTAYNALLKDLKDTGMLPVYDAGFIDMKRQYLTIGINGLNQAAEFLGMECTKNEGYMQFCKGIFSIIKEQNALHKTKDLMFNTEFTPCESAAIKLYNRDKKDGYWVPEDTNLYASYIFKPNDPNISVLDKIYLHGRDFCGDALDGGSAAHINLEEHLSKAQYEKVVKYAAEVGCKYFTFNIPNSECKDCGYITKHPITKCPKCGSENISLWDRIIGYLTEIKHWSEGRRIEQKTRVYSKMEND